MDDELKAELARLNKELNIVQASQPRQDDEVSVGYVPPPLPPDHWSLRPEWRAHRAGLTEDVQDTPADVAQTWYVHAHALSGQTEENA
jgi:hypothetical protein